MKSGSRVTLDAHVVVSREAVVPGTFLEGDRMVQLEEIKLALAQIRKIKKTQAHMITNTIEKKDLDLIERIILDLVPALKGK